MSKYYDSLETRSADERQQTQFESIRAQIEHVKNNTAAYAESLKDIDYLMDRVKDIVAERERLFNQLKELEWLKPFPSEANFILCSVPNGKASDLQQRLQDKGILVRYFNKPFLKDCIRISVGRPEHTDALIKALRELGGEMNV